MLYAIHQEPNPDWRPSSRGSRLSWLDRITSTFAARVDESARASEAILGNPAGLRRQKPN